MTLACYGALEIVGVIIIIINAQVRPWTVTLVLVLQGNVATKLSYCGKIFIQPFLSDSDIERI